ncbi:type ISP restriction/modification enzyme [Roseiflexus castenholzii]|uniref:type ISP restriction/modification enzyme n=1 Tax=Roseiflexus castenholzii TaxID=120962 RepID=UPI003C7AA0DD
MGEPRSTCLHAIADLTQRGDAREERASPALKTLLEELAKAHGRPIQVTVLPKPTEAGAPNFRIWDGSHQVIGYIEAKAPGTNLDQVERSEQLQRYGTTFPNLILTDCSEFRLYREGVLIDRVLLPRPFTPQKHNVTPPAEQGDALTRLLENFFFFALPPSMTPEALARELARRTRFLRDQVILPELNQPHGAVYGFYQAFQHYLSARLTPEQFADLSAQTITYGLFAARTRTQEAFNRQRAYSLLPSTIGILRDVFQFISLGKPSPQMEVIVDDIAAVLHAADVQNILKRYHRQGKGDDPILHFYETFLAAYDSETRERRGVYSTPQPVVDYIVRGVHHLLQARFDLPDGLADHRVTLLDPAAGTLTFPATAIRLAFDTFVARYGAGGKANFLRTHILPHFSAFEILMAPYAIGHLKIGFLLEELGVPLNPGERFQFSLTNALEMEELQQMAIPGLSSRSEENRHMAQVKQDEPILVILGNPPYSGASANQNAWTKRLLKTDLDGAQSYSTVDGQPLREKNLKWLQDDYVKFLRFAQWKVHKAGRGLVAMITNHSYLDNPTFRGMRQSLLKTFDEISILDLHGNRLRRETAPDSGPDENVFDIRQGVAIAFFVKHGKPQPRGLFHADLYGTRKDKYTWLQTHDLTTAGYQPLQPASPFSFFIPRRTQNLAAYQSWPSIPEIFPVNSVGIITARDKLTIHWTEDEAWTTVWNFSRMDEERARQAYQFGRDERAWKVSLAQQDLKRNGGPHRDNIVPILYRPFDVRSTYYTGRSRGFHCSPRPEVMRHMLAGENVALIVPRRVEHRGAWRHAFVAGQMVDHVAVSLKTIDYCFPLSLAPSTTAPGMFPQNRTPNLADWLLPQLTAAYNVTPTPEQVLAYIYAVLYSPTYRQKYAEELRVDFPRAPFTADPEVFRQMADLGQELIDVHLMRKTVQVAGVRSQGQGSDKIEFVRYDPASGRVAINRDQYFEGITPEMWAYQIGGYQVLEKYLNDRKGRQLDDPAPSIHIAEAIARTMKIQAQIDQVYPQVETNVMRVRAAAS